MIDWDDIEVCDGCGIQHDISELRTVGDELLCEQCQVKELNLFDAKEFQEMFDRL